MNAPSEQWILCRLGNIVPHQCRSGSIQGAERIFVVAHLIIFGADRYVPDCRPAQRIVDTLIFVSIQRTKHLS